MRHVPILPVEKEADIRELGNTPGWSGYPVAEAFPISAAQPSVLLQSGLEHFLECVRSEVSAEVFDSGQCHTLAGVLQELFGGELFAIMRHQVTEEGDRFSTTYSHMICEIQGQCYDIDGFDADERWCAKWPEEPDEDGLTNEFEFVPLQPQALLTFIADQRGNPIDQDVLEKLQAVVDSIMPQTPSTSVSFPSTR